jgi:hypothetical protein
MGKKAPTQMMPNIAEAPDPIDREALDQETTAALEEAKKPTLSMKDGEVATNATLLAERDYWKTKEEEYKKKSLLG